MKNKKKYILDWLNYCQKLGVKPWEYDFKQSYQKESLQKEDGLRKILEYKNFQMNERGYKLDPEDRIYRKGEHADADKEAHLIYQLLFPLDKAGLIRGEAMNSFITTFNSAVEMSPHGNTNLEEILKSNRYHEYEAVLMNLELFERFGHLTHSIGNFIVLPHWMNTGRYNFSRDYWDVTLKSFKDFLMPLGAWNRFIELYLLDMYLDEKGEPEEFWDGHLDSYGLNNLFKPNTLEDLRSFLIKVNAKIELRGKIMIKKVLELLELEDHPFYTELKDVE